MKNIYFIYPKNSNLNHCPDSFEAALKKQVNDGSVLINKVKHSDVNSFISVVKKILSSRKNENIIITFSTQPDQAMFLFLIRAIANISNSNVRIYHQMHEPKYEKNRLDVKTSTILYILNLLLSRLSDITLISSEEALSKAKTFIPQSKLFRINLTFLEQDRQFLDERLKELKYFWEQSKTFSLIGGLAKDRNPEGFLALANIAISKYPDRPNQFRFIRAGRDNQVYPIYDDSKVITFISHLSNSAKIFLLSLTHFIVIPYKFSTQSGSLVEALSHGKIPIVNDIQAFQHLQGLPFVFIVDFDDRERINECIEKILSMSTDDYINCYWQAVEYFNQNHSTVYLEEKMSKLLNL